MKYLKKIFESNQEKYEIVEDYFLHLLEDQDEDDPIYCEMEDGTNQLAGHTEKIFGPSGHSKIYVDHFIGKISRAYEHVVTKIRSGEKNKTSTFEMDGVSARGAWKFVHEVGKKKRHELRID